MVLLRIKTTRFHIIIIKYHYHNICSTKLSNLYQFHSQIKTMYFHPMSSVSTSRTEQNHWIYLFILIYLSSFPFFYVWAKENEKRLSTFICCVRARHSMQHTLHLYSRSCRKNQLQQLEKQTCRCPVCNEHQPIQSYGEIYWVFLWILHYFHTITPRHNCPFGMGDRLAGDSIIMPMPIPINACKK